MVAYQVAHHIGSVYPKKDYGKKYHHHGVLTPIVEGCIPSYTSTNEVYFAAHIKLCSLAHGESPPGWCQRQRNAVPEHLCWWECSAWWWYIRKLNEGSKKEFPIFRKKPMSSSLQFCHGSDDPSNSNEGFGRFTLPIPKPNGVHVARKSCKATPKKVWLNKLPWPLVMKFGVKKQQNVFSSAENYESRKMNLKSRHHHHHHQRLRHTHWKK